ncbi:MAG: hypothetical protein WBN45_14665, partial [Arenicellales bacterium]
FKVMLYKSRLSFNALSRGYRGEYTFYVLRIMFYVEVKGVRPGVKGERGKEVSSFKFQVLSKSQSQSQSQSQRLKAEDLGLKRKGWSKAGFRHAPE